MPCFLEVFCYIKATKKHSFGGYGTQVFLKLREAPQPRNSHADAHALEKLPCFGDLRVATFFQNRLSRSFSAQRPKHINMSLPRKKSGYISKEINATAQLRADDHQLRHPPESILRTCLMATSCLASGALNQQNGQQGGSRPLRPL